ncbi:hypothetical protein ACHRVK_03465 [Flavobacterium plurextorum]|uniref:Addiction module component, TIGR02574 family n=1 Tax=Flavobacterium plurextorum TaxID=1114867 RepID=A0ABX4CVQ3_9FLAO|nr:MULTISPECIES: hypothetical protein [Flavobacterium]OXB08911.1 hypothetical protein B0A81_07045 [Flavobacterium plurextorum]PIF69419.1 hypothetical protein CLU99_0123 [Flavobacterium sp. 2]RXM46510.1 hypothetical protein BOW57_02310 [Flavobacterium sp. YO64]UUW10480.1 hypothetical protein NLG42_06645 [Flavobacterium plurextorum]
MDIQLEKREAMEMLKETDDPSIIKAVAKLLRKNKKDWWDDLTDQQKEDIAQSELEFERGEFTSYEDVMKKYR